MINVNVLIINNSPMNRVFNTGPYFQYRYYGFENPNTGIPVLIPVFEI
jgi:hypothetical protein